MDAIIYTTNTGSTGQYAKLLAQETGLPAYSLAEAKKRVFAGAEGGAEGACLFWHIVLLYAALQLQETDWIKQFSIR